MRATIRHATRPNETLISSPADEAYPIVPNQPTDGLTGSANQSANTRDSFSHSADGRMDGARENGERRRAFPHLLVDSGVTDLENRRSCGDDGFIP
jgi:hypothetical protein